MLREEQVAHVPHLAETETLQALRRWLARGWATQERVEAGIDVLGELRLAHHAHPPLRTRVWSLRHAFSAYDATYVALTEMLDATLLTADGAFATAAGDLVEIIDVST